MQNDGLLVIAFGVVLSALLLLLVVSPYYEAETFNKYKRDDQPPATYWDALYSDLRVEAAGAE